VTRVAAVDLGTNSTRLLVADVDGDHVEPVIRRSVVTGLGEGVDARRRLLPVPIARVRNALSDFRRELESLGAERTLAVATSAVRDAENGEAFLGEIEWSYGFDTRLLTGDEEAALTRRGAGLTGERTLLVDIGGGSTELSTASFQVSLDIGSVRLNERVASLDEAAAHIDGLLPELAVADAIGVSGTVHQLADLVEHEEITAEEVERWFETLAALPLEERRALPRMNPDRAPTIVTGTLILRQVLRRYGLQAIRYSERDILHGAALEAAALPARPEGEAPPGAYTCC
jgi:exopolyphosphatase/guanosine-5'-triphosphate,3'-diphosphate pyrophosphatase